MIYLSVSIVLLRLFEIRYYSDFKLAENCIIQNKISSLLKRSNAWLQSAIMITVWLEIALFFEIGIKLPEWVRVPFVALLVAGRFRALQEIGHTALHYGFGGNRDIQWRIADWFGNFWLFKPNSRTRYQGHCIEHHPNANTEKDPNIVRLRSIGFQPGLTTIQFKKYIIHPFTLLGFKETFHLYFIAAGKGLERLIRFTLLALVVTIVTLVYGVWAAAAWLIALLCVYPLYSWWSLLAEHRWFTSNLGKTGRFDHDCEATPRTLYRGITGVLMRYFVSPCTDSLHLAHHMFPSLHWRYLSIADQYLQEKYPNYSTHTMTSLFGYGSQSILYDLKERMILREEAAQ